MRKVRLGDICRVENGFAFDGSRFSRSSGKPLIRIRDLKTNQPSIRFDGDFDQRWIVRPGDILIGMDGEFRIYRWAGPKGLLNQRVCRLTPNPSELDPEFLVLALGAHLQAIEARTSLTTVKHLSSTSIASIELTVPRLPAQKRAAELLSRLLAAVDRARDAHQHRSRLRTDLVRAALEMALRPTPDWTVTPLGNVAHIQLGKMLSPASKTGARPVPYLRNANVQWDRFWLENVAEMDFDEREEAKFLLRPGDVLVCEGGEPGRAAIWEGQIERCCYQKALHRLRPINDAVDPRFLLYHLWLGALRGEFADDHAKTTIAHLPAVRLATLRVAFPPLREQRRIARGARERLAAIEDIHNSLDAELHAIDALPAALIRRVLADHEAA